MTPVLVALFERVGCADCHVGTWTTRNDPALEAAIRDAWNGPRPPQDQLYGDGTAGVQMAEAIARTPLRIEKMLPF